MTSWDDAVGESGAGAGVEPKLRATEGSAYKYDTSAAVKAWHANCISAVSTENDAILICEAVAVEVVSEEVEADAVADGNVVEAADAVVTGV